MNYGNIEKIIQYGTTYRKQELADLLEYTDSYELSDDLCAILITFKSTIPPDVWDKMVDNLFTFQTNVQFQLIREEEEDGEDDQPI